MKLHLRLALPLFAIAIGVTAAGTVGVLALVRNTFGVALQESGQQLVQITANVLKGRARGLEDIAAKLAAHPRNFQKDARTLHGSRVDVAGLIDKSTGNITLAFGPSIDPRDLKKLADAHAPPLFLHTSEGLLIAGVASTSDHTQNVVIGKHLDKEFAAALKELLRADVVISVNGQEVATSLGATASIAALYPVELVRHTPGNTEVKLTLLIPAQGMYAEQRSALILTIAGGMILLLIALLFYGYTVVRVTRPIRDLIVATERISGGDLEAKLPPGAPAELGTLVRQFNAMALALKEMQDRLIHSAKLSSVGSLVAGISHELNNPLLGLLGHAEYLGSKIKPGDLGREELDIILEEGQRMKRILADLRGFLRPGTDARTRFDLNSVVEEVLSLVRHEAAKANVACESVLHAGGVMVNAVPDQLRQILLNMALNGLQAMPQGGHLRILTGLYPTNGSHRARITVEDTGNGIAPEQLKQVTEPFFTTKPGRMGLGLAICQEVVTRHGGTLSVESELGKGTRVTIELPGDNS